MAYEVTNIVIVLITLIVSYYLIVNYKSRIIVKIKTLIIKTSHFIKHPKFPLLFCLFFMFWSTFIPDRFNQYHLGDIIIRYFVIMIVSGMIYVLSNWHKETDKDK